MKKYLILSLLLALCFLLTGCHGSQDTAAFTVPDTFDTSRKTLKLCIPTSR